jgi:hypothetical protein
MQPRERLSILEQFQSNSCAFLSANVIQLRKSHPKLLLHANDALTRRSTGDDEREDESDSLVII